MPHFTPVFCHIEILYNILLPLPPTAILLATRHFFSERARIPLSHFHRWGATITTVVTTGVTTATATATAIATAAATAAAAAAAGTGTDATATAGAVDVMIEEEGETTRETEEVTEEEVGTGLEETTEEEEEEVTVVDATIGDAMTQTAAETTAAGPCPHHPRRRKQRCVPRCVISDPAPPRNTNPKTSINHTHPRPLTPSPFPSPLFPFPSPYRHHARAP